MGLPGHKTYEAFRPQRRSGRFKVFIEQLGQVIKSHDRKMPGRGDCELWPSWN